MAVQEITLQQMLEKLHMLKAEEVKVVFDEAGSILASESVSDDDEQITSEGRIFDLHPGAMIMSPDFDDELPDSFWFGEDE